MRRSLAAALLAACTAAAAHDTWFERLPSTSKGEVALALGTGTRFPGFEFPIGLEQIVASGCRGDGVVAAPLALLADRPDSIRLRSAAPVSPSTPLACWAQLVPFEVEIEPPIVQIYLDEINALPVVRAAWAEQRARGVRWRESYTKHARIELGSGAGVKTAPVPMAMDALLDASRRPVRRGDAVVLQVLRDGKPLAGLPVEIHSDRSQLGFWRQTDADGRVRLTMPLAGRWLLRGTDLRQDERDRDRWVSRFVTLAFDVVD